MFNNKKLTILFLSCLIIEFPIKADDTQNPYIDVFDESIYNQRKVAKKYKEGSKVWDDITTLIDPEIRKEILELLIKKKIKCLVTKMFPRFDLELRSIESQMALHKPSNGRIALKVMGNVLAAGTNFALLTAMNPGTAAVKGVETGAKAVQTAGTAVKAVQVAVASGGGIAGAMMLSLHDFWDPTNGELNFVGMRTVLDNRKKDLLNQIIHENISDLEFEYVLRKRFYPRGLRTTIEKYLLSARSPALFPSISSIREYLGNCLNFPIQKKVIPNNPYFSDLEKSLDNDTKAKKELCAYNDDTRNEFAYEILRLMASSNSSIPSTRRVFYVEGEPGIGKSKAAEAIANHLGLPVYKTSIRSREAISESSLEGKPYSSQNSNLGTIARALLTGRREKDQEDEFTTFKIVNPEASNYGVQPEFTLRVRTKKAQETYKNTVIILNDFDRLLLDATTTTETLAMLLDYLDPMKKEFFSFYFDQDVPIEDLTFIITANTTIPKPKPSQISNESILRLMRVVIESQQLEEQKSKEEEAEKQEEKESLVRAKRKNLAILHIEFGKLELEGKGLQNQKEAKEKARNHFEKAKELGNQEASRFLEAMNEVDAFVLSTTAPEKTVDTDSDSFKAVRSRTKQIKCTGLMESKRKDLYEQHLEHMLERYELEIEVEKQENIIKEAQKILSIRDATAQIEEEVIKIKKERFRVKELVTEKVPTSYAESEKNSLQSSSTKEESMTSSKSPESKGKEKDLTEKAEKVPPEKIEERRIWLTNQVLPGLEMEPELQKKVSTLYNIAALQTLMSSHDEQKEAEAIDKLLGNSSFIERYWKPQLLEFIPGHAFFGQPNQIQALWRTRSHRKGEMLPTTDLAPESETNLGALENRMIRLKKFPQKQYQIFRFHLELARVIATKLLQFEKNESTYRKISEVDFRRNNLISFCNHLEALEKEGKKLIDNLMQGKSNKFYKICSKVYKDYKAWFEKSLKPAEMANSIGQTVREESSENAPKASSSSSPGTTKDALTCSMVIKAYYGIEDINKVIPIKEGENEGGEGKNGGAKEKEEEEEEEKEKEKEKDLNDDDL